MKKNLHRLCLLLVGVLTMFSAQQARASHAIGGDMSYMNVGPGLYFVTYRFYRDCSGIVAPGNFTLTYEATGCGPTNTTNPGGTKLLVKRGIAVGNPYCRTRNTASPCDTAGSVSSPGFPNYHIYTYAAVVVLGTGAGSECTEWVMSTDLNARPNTANLGFGNTLYTEVRFNTKLVQDDSSPVFPSAVGFQPLIFTCDTTYSETRSDVVDPDNIIAGFGGTDSLVYTSLQPLTGPTMPAPYTPGYTLAAPMRVWTGIPLESQPVDSAGRPRRNYPFEVNPITGTIRFSSGSATVGSPDDQDNKFAVSIGVESWRRINGVRRKISTVRRDILVVIFRCPQRTRAPFVPGGGTGQVINQGIDSTIVVNTTDTITVDACANAQLDINVNDINGDSVFVNFLNSQLPGQAALTVFSQTSAGGITQAVVRLNWAPDSSTIGGYYPVTIRLRDDGCPLPSRTDQPLILHVIRRQYADVGLFTSNNNGANDTLCVGQITKLVATTRLPATVGFPPVPAVYTYQWLMDADSTIVRTNGDTAVVRPRRTTRYYLNVYSPLRCMDTTSILVRVDPTNRAYSEPDSVCPGQSATLALTGRTRRVGPGNVPIVYTYKWVDSAAIKNNTPTTLSNDSIQTPVATPLVTTRYFATIYSSIGCTDTASAVVFSKGAYPVFDSTQNVTQDYRFGRELTYGQNGIPSLAASNDTATNAARRFRYRIYGPNVQNVFYSDTLGNPSVRTLNLTTKFTLVAANALGCETRRTFIIVVPLNVPNIITPNGDNKNDAFIIEGVKTAELTIYNRWGRQVRDWKEYDNKWAGEDVSAGTYYYLLRDKEQNKTYKGWLQIVK